MPWIRSRLAPAAALVACAHLAAFAATSIALCCWSHLGADRGAEACPLHRAAEATDALTEHPLHGGSPDHHAEGVTVGLPPATGATHPHGTAAAPSSHGEPCRLVCDTQDASLAILLGLPGLLPAAGALPLPDQVTALPRLGAASLPDQVVAVSIPPPRFS